LTFGRASGKKRGIPHGAENAEPGGAGHKEAEAIQRMSDILCAITQRDYGDGGVFDGTEQRFE
jgi:hypothetical protein